MNQQHPHRLIGLPEVIHMTSLSRSTILRMIEKNKFPPPSLVSGRNLWLFEAVEGWNLEQVGKVQDNQVDTPTA